MTGRNGYQVLVAESQESRRQQIVELFSDRYPVMQVDSADAALAEAPSVDCIVVGDSSPDSVEELLAIAGDREVVILLLAARFDRATIETVSRTEDAEVVFDQTTVDSSAESGSSPETIATDDSEEEADEPIATATLDTLDERVETRYRESISDLSDAVLAASRSLMGAALDEVDTKIEWELKSVGQRLDVDRCAFYRHEAETDLLVRTHVWDDSDSSDETERVDAANFPGFETLAAFDPVSFPEIQRDSTPAATDGAGEIEVPDGFVGDVDLLDDDSGGSGGSGSTVGDHDSGGTGDDGIEVPDGFVGNTDLLDGDDDDDDEDDRPWPPYLDDQGFGAFAAVPVVIDWSLYGVLAVGRDDRRQWSEELCRQLRTLGEHVGYTLQRRRRRQELEDQNERLERFASVISHDLQNPISVISGYTELAIETEDTDPLTDVMEAADRMERLVTDLLMLAREGDTLGDTRTVSLASMAESAWTAVDSPEATLLVETDSEFEADPSRLQQVLENLFKNAVEHVGDDVTLTVEGTDDGFAVEDDGPGIPPDKRDEVFDEGVTGGDGTGLGLAIVNSVVEAHGWSISIDEGSAGGARFEVEFGDGQAAD